MLPRRLSATSLSAASLDRPMNSRDSLEPSPFLQHYQLRPPAPAMQQAAPPMPSALAAPGPALHAPPPQMPGGGAGSQAGSDAERIQELLLLGLRAAFVWHLQHKLGATWQQARGLLFPQLSPELSLRCWRAHGPA